MDGAILKISSLRSAKIVIYSVLNACVLYFCSTNAKQKVATRTETSAPRKLRTPLFNIAVD